MMTYPSARKLPRRKVWRNLPKDFWLVTLGFAAIFVIAAAFGFMERGVMSAPQVVASQQTP